MPELLTANRNYYVRTDGSDANTGLADNSGGAFLTIQKALNVVADTLDMRGFSVTIQVADGTYTGANAVSRPWTGEGTVIVTGNATTPANVVISTTSASCFFSTHRARLVVQNLKVQAATSGAGLYAYAHGIIEFSNIVFGSFVGDHIVADYYGMVLATGNYSIVGNAGWHVHSNYYGLFSAVGRTITLSGTPAFTYGFVGNRGSIVAFLNCTFVGSATGSRFTVHRGGVIDTLNAGLTALPGSSAGIIYPGAVYDAITA